jgi:enolase
MSTIKNLHAIEILDSRGRPTLKTTCELSSGFTASASVPSGASTGKAEALELRDGDKKRFRGLGCLKAVNNVNTVLNDTLTSPEFNQETLDKKMLELDGTVNKSRLGANAILSVSLAFARACALEQNVQLYQYFAKLADNASPKLPRLTVNLFSGGKHAGGQVAIQDLLVVPLVNNVSDALAMTFEIYQSAAELSAKKYNMRALRADEGGLAPLFPNVTVMIEDALQAIQQAGFLAGDDVSLALDVASSHFYQNGLYHLDGQSLMGGNMIDLLESWLRDYPIVSLEDGLAEEDWDHWTLLRERVGNKALVLGDDLLCTNPQRIQKAIDFKAANALLLKVNQIGTLSEAAEAYKLARSDNWKVVVSARSGETEDNWLADLAVAWSGDYIKIGSITQSERLAKYNRLLELEADTNTDSE